MISDVPERPPLTPRYWPSWFAVGLIWLTGKLPQWAGNLLAPPLAWLMKAAMKRRRRIALRNVEACFPDLSPAEQQAIVDQCFRSLARAVFEIAWCWSGSENKFRRMTNIEGAEHLAQARTHGKGVLVVTGHSTCLEIGGRVMGAHCPDGRGFYRPLKNPVIEWYQNTSRARYASAMISKRKMRSAIRVLNQGGVLWYAPDQDFGSEQSLFVPFFGIQTATLLATHRLAAITGCSVVPMFPVYHGREKKYTIKILPALENFPGKDPAADLERVNAIIEAHVREHPDQYWWIHRRFKTRPEGEPPFYD